MDGLDVMSRYDNTSRPELNLFLDPDHVTKTTRHRQIIDYLEKLGCGGNDYKEEIDFLVRQNALFSSLPKEEYRHYLLVTYSFLQGLGYSSTSMKSLMENISNTIEGSITATPFDVVGKQYYQGKYIINPMQDLSRGDTCLLVDKNDINMISSRLRGEKGKKMMMLVSRIFSDIMTRNENVIETHAEKTTEEVDKIREERKDKGLEGIPSKSTTDIIQEYTDKISKIKEESERRIKMMEERVKQQAIEYEAKLEKKDEEIEEISDEYYAEKQRAAEEVVERIKAERKAGSINRQRKAEKSITDERKSAVVIYKTKEDEECVYFRIRYRERKSTLKENLEASLVDWKSGENIHLGYDGSVGGCHWQQLDERG